MPLFAIGTDPDEPIARLCLRGNYRHALQHLPEDHPGRGELLYWLGDPGARKELRRLGNRPAEARVCWQLDLYEEGLELLRDLPPDGYVELTRDLILLCQGQRLEPSLHLHETQRWHACYDLGVTYQFLGQAAPAEGYFRQALAGWQSISADHPEAANSLFGLSGVLERAKAPEFTRVAQEFLNVTRTDPRRPQVLEALTVWHVDHKEWAQAEQTLPLHEDPASRAQFLGTIRFLQGRGLEAIEPLRSASTAYRQSALPLKEGRCRWILARIYHSQGTPGWQDEFSAALECAAGDAALAARIAASRDEATKP